MEKMRAFERRVQTRMVAEHEKNFDPANVKEDLIDMYLNEMYKAKQTEKEGIFSRFQLIRLCSDMLVAGTDTTGEGEFVFEFSFTCSSIQFKI